MTVSLSYKMLQLLLFILSSKTILYRSCVFCIDHVYFVFCIMCILYFV